ncbi:MAG: hypothetical protein H6Q37_101 [Chloroflexi bacterium]|nr:hypothetical protein [Chloroflexota bacterium]
MDTPESFTAIDIPFPEGSGLSLKLQVGACKLNITPGTGASWVTGIYEDRGGSLPVKILQEGSTARISQEFRFGEWWERYNGAPPRFDLALGKSKPYTLSLETGASESRVDLGGLPLTRLLIRHGAGHAVFDFSAPLSQPIGLLELEAGAAGLEMTHLANANFAEMVVHGGAAGYKFDFSGELRREGHVRITAGMASVEIMVPTRTAVKVSVETTLGNVDLGDGFTRKEGAYWNQAALEGSTPLLDIHSNVTMGSIKIRQS